MITLLTILSIFPWWRAISTSICSPKPRACKVPGLARDAVLFKASFLLSLTRVLDVTIWLAKGMHHELGLRCGRGTETHMGSWAFDVHEKTSYLMVSCWSDALSESRLRTLHALNNMFTPIIQNYIGSQEWFREKCIPEEDCEATDLCREASFAARTQDKKHWETGSNMHEASQRNTKCLPLFHSVCFSANTLG